MKNEKIKTFKPGMRIITHGDEAQFAYLILKGSVEAFLERDGRIVKLGELGIGDVFGETALFGGETYGANVDTTTETEVALISPQSFAGKIDAADPMLKAIVKMLIERLRKTNEALLNSETREFMDIALV